MNKIFDTSLISKWFDVRPPTKTNLLVSLGEMNDDEQGLGPLLGVICKKRKSINPTRLEYFRKIVPKVENWCNIFTSEFGEKHREFVSHAILRPYKAMIAVVSDSTPGEEFFNEYIHLKWQSSEAEDFVPVLTVTNGKAKISNFIVYINKLPKGTVDNNFILTQNLFNRFEATCDDRFLQSTQNIVRAAFQRVSLVSKKKFEADDWMVVWALHPNEHEKFSFQEIQAIRGDSASGAIFDLILRLFTFSQVDRGISYLHTVNEEGLTGPVDFVREKVLEILTECTRLERETAFRWVDAIIVSKKMSQKDASKGKNNLTLAKEAKEEFLEEYKKSPSYHRTIFNFISEVEILNCDDNVFYQRFTSRSLKRYLLYLEQISKSEGRDIDYYLLGLEDNSFSKDHPAYLFRWLFVEIFQSGIHEISSNDGKVSFDEISEMRGDVVIFFSSQKKCDEYSRKIAAFYASVTFSNLQNFIQDWRQLPLLLFFDYEINNNYEDDVTQSLKFVDLKRRSQEFHALEKIFITLLARKSYVALFNNLSKLDFWDNGTDKIKFLMNNIKTLPEGGRRMFFLPLEFVEESHSIFPGARKFLYEEAGSDHVI